MHQLLLAGLISVILISAMGWIAFWQTNRMFDQTKMLYDHSLVVRRSIGELKTGILLIHRSMKDIFLFPAESDLEEQLADIEIYKADVEKQISIIERHYLGDPDEVKAIKQTYLRWNSLREETLRLRLEAGNMEAAARTRRDGVAGVLVEELLQKIEVVSHWSMANADKLYLTTQAYNSSLNRQVLLILVAFVTFLGLIFTLIYQGIRLPLRTISVAAAGFRAGNYSTRSAYHSHNELGRLSQDFNTLADTMEETLALIEKSNTLAFNILQNHHADLFFNELLTGLLKDTCSQQGLIYLLNHELDVFELKASIGGNAFLRQTFDSGLREGEIGQSLATGEIVYLTGLSMDTRFVFNTTNGHIIPEEMVTIPVVAGGDTLAVITLAKVGKYSETAKGYLAKVYPMVCARVAGILAYIRMEKLTEILEIKNSELELQSQELSQQSAELERQNMELELQKGQLQEASLLKTSFLSNMSHELRTPLNSIITLSGLLHRQFQGTIPDKEHGFLGIIERNGQRLLELINDILNISRIESGRVEVKVTEFKLDELVDELLQVLIPQAEAKGLTLEKADPLTGIVLSTDRKKFYHILQNLIGNAIKFTDHGQVKIYIGHDDETIRMTIADTGIGIDAEHLPYIFDEFRQVDSSTSRRHEGSGLGLSIAYKYAQILQGNITVKSEPGKGSEFCVELPKCYEDVNKGVGSFNTIETPEGPTISDTSISNGKTILIVEDSEAAIIQLKDILEDAGFTTLVVRNGTEALDLLEHTHPDGIILDLMMPGVDGFTVLKTIRESDLTATIPVMILTAKHISQEELRFLKHNNIHQLITKGAVSKSALLSAVINMII